MEIITQHIIEIGGAKLTLSPEEARALQAELNRLYPVGRETDVVKEYIPAPYLTPYPIYPIPAYPPPITWTSAGSQDITISPCSGPNATFALNN